MVLQKIGLYLEKKIYCFFPEGGSRSGFLIPWLCIDLTSAVFCSVSWSVFLFLLLVICFVFFLLLYCFLSSFTKIGIYQSRRIAFYF
jgi:hypothetical protein